MDESSLLEAVRAEAHVLQQDERHDRILDEIGDATIVLLGEATHGTREFYRLRAELTKRLITQKGFDAIAVEADWPDALRVNRYIQDSHTAHAEHDMNAQDALRGFRRFPQWMWRNTEVVELVEWLRRHNMQRAAGEGKVGFFGLDVYSLHSSMEAVIRYLSHIDPEEAQQARARYACFDHLAKDPQRYGYAATFGTRKDCEDEVVRQLVDLNAKAAHYLAADGPHAEDELFYAQQNARVVQNAEAYYRTMYLGRNDSWNLRDEHMAETLHALRTHIEHRKGRQGPAKIVVWAHNSHIGDARETEMGDHGQLNLGQLVRQRYPRGESFLLGFSTHTGTVTAASEWDAPAELKAVRASLPDSFERFFHNCGLGNFFLPLRHGESSSALKERRLERAIGVIYLPDSERISHYFHASLARQFDAVIHVDKTHALKPLEKTVEAQHDEVSETYPSGI